MRCKDFVNLFKDFRDRIVHGFINGDFEVTPEVGQHFLVIGLTCGHVVQFFLKTRSVIIADIFAEIIGQERRNKAAFVLRDQAIFVFADVFAILNGRDDGRVGGRAANAKFFHPLDQRRLSVAGRWLGEMLFCRDGCFPDGFALCNLRQALVVVVNHVRINVIAAFFIDTQKSVKQHNLTSRAQFNLTVRRSEIDGRAFHPRGLHLT